MIHNLTQSRSLIDEYVAQLRDIHVQKDSWRFRQNLERIGFLIGYEISKKMEYESIKTQTPLGVADTFQVSRAPVVATILRAGLPLHQGVLNAFDKSENAFVSAYRKHNEDGTFEIQLDYISCPSLEGKTLILCDPMLATGASIVTTIRQLRQYGIPAHTHIACAIASTEGIEYIKSNLENYTLWTAAIDDELTDKGYIYPGLGDAGDLAYGVKMQQ
jgi:uracil phosphoribosyltransferase